MSKFNVTAVLEYKFVLVLNPMTANIENQVKVGEWDTREQARAYYESEKVEPYSDSGPNMFEGGSKTYRKTFRKGGPLEMLNPIEEIEWTIPSHYGHGLHELITDITNITKLDQLPY